MQAWGTQNEVVANNLAAMKLVAATIKSSASLTDLIMSMENKIEFGAFLVNSVKEGDHNNFSMIADFVARSVENFKEMKK